FKTRSSLCTGIRIETVGQSRFFSGWLVFFSEHSSPASVATRQESVYCRAARHSPIRTAMRTTLSRTIMIGGPLFSSIDPEFQSDMSAVKIVGLAAAVFHHSHQLQPFCQIERHRGTDGEIRLVEFARAKEPIIARASTFNGDPNRNLTRLSIEHASSEG